MRDIEIGFSSDRYNYVATFWVDEEIWRVWFELDATCKSTGRESTVTLVNEVIGYFGVDIHKKRFNESEWKLKDKEVLKFQNKVAELMAMDDLTWLDDAMDEDRREGEWVHLEGGE